MERGDLLGGVGYGCGKMLGLCWFGLPFLVMDVAISFVFRIKTSTFPVIKVSYMTVPKPAVVRSSLPVNVPYELAANGAY